MHWKSYYKQKVLQNLMLRNFRSFTIVALARCPANHTLRYCRISIAKVQILSAFLLSLQIFNA